MKNNKPNTHPRTKGPKPPKTPVPPRAREATGRQRQYVAGVMAGKTKLQAKREAGYRDNTKGKEIEQRPAVAALFTKLMDQAGITDTLLARRIAQGLSANSVMRETQHADREVLIDFSERREMVELALKLKGHLIDTHEIRGSLTLEELLEGTHE